jgi:hypothetical protein
MPKDRSVVGSQANAVPVQLPTEAIHVTTVMVTHQCGGLIGDAVPGQQCQCESQCLGPGQAWRTGTECYIEATDACEHPPAEGHVGTDAEWRQWVERVLRAVPGKRGRLKSPTLGVPSELLKQLLRRGVQAGGDDRAGDTADVGAPGEAAREPGKPMIVRFVVIIEEGDDFAGRGGYTCVAGPREPGPRLRNVMVPNTTLPGFDQGPDGVSGRNILDDHDLEVRIHLLVKLPQAGD